MDRTFDPTLRASSPSKLTTAQVDGNWTGLAEVSNAAARSYTAASEPAMLALTPTPGANDLCWRLDLNKPFFFTGGSAASIANWRTIPAADVGVAHEATSVAIAANPGSSVGSSVGSVDLGRYFDIQKEVSTTSAGIFRLYRTSAARDADVGRAVTSPDAAASAGCILEDVFTADALTIEWCDVPAHAGDDGLCYWSWAGSAGTTVTLRVLVKEA